MPALVQVWKHSTVNCRSFCLPSLAKALVSEWVCVMLMAVRTSTAATNEKVGRGGWDGAIYQANLLFL